MRDPHQHAAPTERHEGPIKTPRQLVAAILFAFIIPIGVIVLLVKYVSSSAQPGAGTELSDEHAVAQRLAKVGQVEVAAAPAADPAASSTEAPPEAAAPAPSATPAPAPVPEAAAPEPEASSVAAAAPAAAPAGGQPTPLYQQSCAMCHESGLAGAPKHGVKADWEPRLAQGVDTLVQHVISGKGAMPPRGGSAGSDADIHATVEYMLEAVK